MLTLRSLRPLLAVFIFTVLAAPVFAQQQAPLPSKVVPPAAQSLWPPPQVAGKSACLMDLDTGRVLYAKNPHERLPNASTTKMMTTILLIEHCKLTDRIKASKNASETPYTSLHLKPGETITVKDLLTGMLIRSANDAAVAAAEHIAGSTAKFADMMNAKAKSIGCTDTHFVTPNGLYDPNHYSSAYDLCLIARYAMRYPVFNEAVRTRKYFLDSRTMNRDDLCVFAHSRFLRCYPGADGVKSGYTKQSRKCYVGSATHNGWRLVSTVLGSSDTNHDTALMMDYGFASYEPIGLLQAGQKCADVNVCGGWRKTIPAMTVQAFRVPVAKTGGTITTKLDLKKIEAPIEKGAKLGTLDAIIDGRKVASVDVVAGTDMGVSLARRLLTILKGCGIIVACLIGGRYVGKASKGTRRRRRGISSSMRGYDRWR